LGRLALRIEPSGSILSQTPCFGANSGINSRLAVN
jgi:hypothetical protein